MIDIQNYDSLYALSKKMGYVSSETFGRHLESLRTAKRMKIRTIQIGTRTKYHTEDVAQLMSDTKVAA